MNRNSSLAHYRIAEVFFLQNNYQSAANEFREALNGDLEPKWTEVWSHINLGKIFDITGQRERAVNEYKQAHPHQGQHAGRAGRSGQVPEGAVRAKAAGFTVAGFKSVLQPGLPGRGRIIAGRQSGLVSGLVFKTSRRLEESRWCVRFALPSAKYPVRAVRKT